MYKVIDSHTGLQVAVVATRKAASNKAERMNQAYGAVRYMYQAI